MIESTYRRDGSAAPVLSRLRSRGALLCEVLGCLLVAWPAWAGVTQCVGASGVGLCPTSVSPCVVTTPVAVNPGSTVDCTGIDVELSGSGSITVEAGQFTLLADDIAVGSGRRIEAVADPVVATGFELALTGSLNVAGQLLADNGGNGSTIAVQADGPISLTGANPAIRGVGVTQSGDGADVFMVSGSSILIDKGIFLNGKEGGDEDNVNAGGSLWLDAAGNVEIHEEIRVYGKWFGGGDISIESGGDILIVHDTTPSGPKGTIVAEGRSLTGYGGQVDLAAAGSIQIGGPILLAGGINNGGGEARGGSLGLAAGCGGISIEDSIDLAAGSRGGGYVVADSEGPILVSGSIDASGKKLGGDGGVVLLVSGQSITLTPTAVVSANGHNSAVFGEDGEGGLLLFAGCSVVIDDTATTGATLTATGAVGGTASVEGSKTPLQTTELSVRVGNKSQVITTGENVAGSIYLEVGTRRVGYCSNNVTAPCSVDSQCVFGCNAGTCTSPSPNPSTDGSVAQFQPAPVIEERGTLNPCTTLCP